MPETKEKMISKRERIVRMNAALKELMEGKTIYRPQKQNTDYFDKAIEFITFGAHPDMENAAGETLLYQAIAMQNVEALKKLVKVPGINLNKRIRPRGFVSSLKTLIQRTGDFISKTTGLPLTIRFESQKGISPVYFAAETGQVEMIDILKEAGANLDRPNRFKQSPLLAMKRDIQTTEKKKLEALGAHEIGKHPKQQQSITVNGLLHRLNEKGKKVKQKAVAVMPHRSKEEHRPKNFTLRKPVNPKDYELQKALSEFEEGWAYMEQTGRDKAFDRHFTKCIQLIKEGANPNVSVSQHFVGKAKHYTLLHQAAASKQIRWVQEVLKLPGVDPNVWDDHGTRPIHIVAKRQHSGADIMKVLCSVPGIDLNAQDEKGNTPMYYLIQGVGLSKKGGPVMSAKELWETGKVDLDIKNNVGQSCRDLLTFVPGDVASYLRKMTEKKELTVQDMVRMRAQGQKIDANR